MQLFKEKGTFKQILSHRPVFFFSLLNWAQFTGGRITLLRGLPSSIVFPGFLYMSGRVTLGGRSHYLLSKVTFPGRLTFCHAKGRGRVTLLRGLSLRLSDHCCIRAIYKNGLAWLCLLVEVAPGTTLHM